MEAARKLIGLEYEIKKLNKMLITASLISWLFMEGEGLVKLS